LNGTITITTNSVVWPNNIGIAVGNSITTIVGDWTINGSLTFAQNGNTINGTGTIYIGGNFLGVSNASGVAGTISIELTGTGNLGGYIACSNFTINASGTYTITSIGITVGAGCNFTLTSGTVDGTTNINTATFQSCTLSGFGSTNFYNSILNGTTVITSDLTFIGNLVLSQNFTQTGVYNIYVGGNFSCNGSYTGQATIILNGTGILSGTGTLAGFNLIINTAGTITVSGTFTKGAVGTITYIAGTVVTTGSTLAISGSISLDAAGINWNNVTLSNTQTLTLLNDLIIDGTFAIANITGRTYTINGFNIYANGSVNLNAIVSYVVGTTKFIFSGTG
ncbi:MAG TPA: hypothetical protein PKI46_10310, partial [Bacteroidales bacterium]|nr:hypothetical protein [Bacteroidales bacterium]